MEPYDPLKARREAVERAKKEAEKKAVEDAILAKAAAKAAAAAAAIAVAATLAADASVVLSKRCVRMVEEAEAERIADQRKNAADLRREVWRARLHHLPALPGSDRALADGCTRASTRQLPPACDVVPLHPSPNEKLAAQRRFQSLLMRRKPLQLAHLQRQLELLIDARLQPDVFCALALDILGYQQLTKLMPDLLLILPTVDMRVATLREHHAFRVRRELALVQRNSSSRMAVDFDGFGLGDVGVSALATALHSNRCIHTMQLSRNNIGASGMRALCAVLAPAVAPCGPSKLTLTALDLRSNGLGDGGAHELAVLLRDNGALRVLELADNALGNARTADAGLRALGAAAQRCPSLRALGLASNKLGAPFIPPVQVGVNALSDERFAVFRRKLEIGVSMRSVKKLLRRHRTDGKPTFSTADIVALEKWWADKTAVIPDEAVEAGVRCICRALAPPARVPLLSLELSCNRVGAFGGVGIGDALQHSASLHTLRLRDNLLGNEAGAGLSALAEGLAVVHDNPRFRHAIRHYRTEHDLEDTLNAMSVEGSELGTFDAVELGAFARYIRSCPPTRVNGVSWERIRMREPGTITAVKTPLSSTLASRVLVSGVKIAAIYANVDLSDVDLHVIDLDQFYPATVVALNDGMTFDLEFAEEELMRRMMESAGRRSVHTIDLSQNRIHGRDVRNLCAALENNASVTRLDLNSNRLGDVGAKTIARALQNNSSITSIGLASNAIGLHGFTVLAEVLSKIDTLLHIDLGWNNDVAHDVHQERVPRSHLKLDNGLLPDDLGIAAQVQARCKGSKGFFEGVVTNRRVDKTFDIRFKMPAVHALARALGSNCSLTNVRLDGNALGTGGAQALATALEQNLTLTEISLGNNNIGEAGTLALAPLLELGSLERVQLSGKVMLPYSDRGQLDWLTSLEAASEVQYYC